MEQILIDNLWFSYGKQPVLEAINLKINAGDFLGIIGPNGGGKSSLVKALLGLIKPQEGSIKILGNSVTKSRKQLGYVPQYFEFDRHFPIKVEEVVKMGRLGKRRLLQRYNQHDQKIVEQSLEQVEMIEFRHHCISDLSGGQCQRVYLARALASQPQILLLDEPTASVDSRMQKSIYELLKELNQYITIIMISHDLGAISTYVKTIACLNRRLYYHGDKLITPEMIEKTYNCPVDLIAHGIPHRVLPEHT